MTSLAALWLPILLSGIIVFVASSIVHMLLPWHRNDYPRLPREQEFRAAVGALALPPGDYMVPRATSTEEMKSDAFRQQWREGPNVIMTVLPPGEMGMGRSLALWFVYVLVIALFGAYIGSRALAPGADYLRVFQLVGATTFIGFAGGLWQMWIWYRRSARVTLTSTVDALLYALLVGGVFGWLWPR